MEYVCLLGALITLFCGLLFFLDKFPLPEYKLLAQIVAITVIVGSSLAVVIMIVWDVRTRVKKSKHRYEAKRRKLFTQVQTLKQQGKPFMHLVHRLNGLKTRYTEDGKVSFVPPLFWDVRDSEEEEVTSFASLIENLFSWHRVKKNLQKIRRRKITMRMK